MKVSNIIGKRFVKLTVMSEAGHNGKNELVYRCKCDCGNEKIVPRGRLICNGTRSCGCFRGERVRTKHPPYYWIYTRIVRNSDERHQPCLLPFEEFLAFTKINKCHYCGSLVQWYPYHHLPIVYHLDRKDSDFGYSKNNCVVCCSLCNAVKGITLSYEEMLLLGPSLRKIKDSRLIGQSL